VLGFAPGMPTGNRLDFSQVAFRLVVLLAIAVGCSRHARVHAPGEVWLSEIKVTGNKTIPDDDLIPGLALERARRDGLLVDTYQLSLDTKRIRGAYLRLGFFEAKVDSQIDREDNAQIVVFTIVEGPRSKARVSVTGLPKQLTEAAVLAKLELKEGDPFDYDLYDEGKEIVKGMVEEVGYPFVDLEESVVTVDRRAKVAAASYRVVISGPRDAQGEPIPATFGPVTIVGVDPESDLTRAIRGRLSFREGDPYTPHALADTQRALYELGRFAQVRVDISRTQKETVAPVTITVEKLAGQVELKLGAGGGYEGFSTERPYLARVRGGVTWIPPDLPLWTFTGDGQLGVAFKNVDLSGAELKGRILGNAQRLELFGPFISGDFGAGFDILAVESYSAFGPLLRAGITAPLGTRKITASAGWAFSYFRISDIDDVIDAVTQRQLGVREDTFERNGRFEQSITFELRDKPLDPRKGAYLSLRVGEGGVFAGGAFNYLQIQPDLRGYLPIRRRSVLAFRVRGGNYFGDAPLTGRFFSGGPVNHRGFGTRELAPSVCRAQKREIDPVTGETNVVLDLDTPSYSCAEGAIEGRDSQNGGQSVVIGGTALLEVGAELRIPIGALFGNLLYGTTLFVDGGDVTNAVADINLKNLYWAAGVGLFIKYGGFKVRIDVGRRFRRIGPEDLQYDPDGTLKNTTLFFGVGETY
jgi:outer membrane protein assembly factor BamA